MVSPPTQASPRSQEKRGESKEKEGVGNNNIGLIKYEIKNENQKEENSKNKKSSPSSLKRILKGEVYFDTFKNLIKVKQSKKSLVSLINGGLKERYSFKQLKKQLITKDY